MQKSGRLSVTYTTCINVHNSYNKQLVIRSCQFNRNQVIALMGRMSNAKDKVICCNCRLHYAKYDCSKPNNLVA